MITVVGLGFGPESVSLKGKKRIDAADKVVLRSALTPPSRHYKAKAQSLDGLFEKARSFDELNSMIVDELIELGRDCDLVYCVDGDGYKDSSVAELIKRTEAEIIAGPFDLAISPSTSCMYISAYDALDKIYPDPALPICIYNIDDANMASEVKLFLLKFFAPEAEATLCTGRGKTTIKLEDLDRQKKYYFDTAIYIEKSNNSSFADLLRIMARLTAPNGCPWDKAQTHESIRINLLEEAYETVEAITDGNIDGMIEELGDVLLQVVFHCDIAFRTGEFTLEDVIKGLNDKLVSRHTHIFGLDKADSADGALSVWERNKMKEKHQDTFAAAVNDIPHCFPALLRAQKAIKRTEKGGWGWKNSQFIANALIEKISELNLAVEKKESAAVSDILGDALLYLVSLGQSADCNCEQALLDKVSRVQKVYTAYERAVLNDGKDVHSLSEEQRREYYSRAIADCDKDRV